MFMNDQPTFSYSNLYAVRVKSHIDPHWDWLAGFSVTHLDQGETLITGPIADQAALHGLLNRIRDMNLELISVEQVSDDRF